MWLICYIGRVEPPRRSQVRLDLPHPLRIRRPHPPDRRRLDRSVLECRLAASRRTRRKRGDGELCLEPRLRRRDDRPRPQHVRRRLGARIATVHPARRQLQRHGHRRHQRRHRRTLPLRPVRPADHPRPQLLRRLRQHLRLRLHARPPRRQVRQRADQPDAVPQSRVRRADDAVDAAGSARICGWDESISGLWRESG
jgi:hypothetical protein